MSSFMTLIEEAGRKARRLLTAVRGATEPAWASELRAAQETVSAHDPLDYYSVYRQHELNYWYNIPAWIRADVKQQLQKPLRVLDIGCAYGTLSTYVRTIADCEVYCIDFMPYMSKKLIEKNNIKYKINNIEREPFPWPEARFDVILFTEILEHLNFAPVPTLRKLHDLCSDRGKIYLSTPDASSKGWGRTTKYYASLDEIPPAPGVPGAPVIDDHVWQYSRDELERVVSEAGLKVERFDYAPGATGLDSRHFNMTLVPAHARSGWRIDAHRPEAQPHRNSQAHQPGPAV